MPSLYKHVPSVPFKWFEIRCFVAFAAGSSQTPVSSAKCLSDFCDVCTNLAIISTFLGNHTAFSAGFLSRSDPADLTLLTNSWILVVHGIVIPGNSRRNFFRNFLA
jgi:hypothetical protein